MNGSKKKIAILILILAVILIINILHKQKPPIKVEIGNWSRRNKLDYVTTRDFISYDCENMKRIGGLARYVKNAPDPLYRIDGAWYLCFDKQLAPKKNDCNVFSFGVNTDYSFDLEMNSIYGCNLYSFDPIIEDYYFSRVRHSNPKLSFSPVLEVNDKWKFYRIGISNRSTASLNSLRIGDKLELKNILKLTGLENKVVDVFKMDIEGEEVGVFKQLDMSYACKYFKQIVFETHKNFRFKDLVKLEECFFMFYRHTRFFIHDLYNQPTGLLTEFQQKNFSLDISLFKNETYLAEYMFVNGEFYFANENFFT